MRKEDNLLEITTLTEELEEDEEQACCNLFHRALAKMGERLFFPPKKNSTGN